MVCLQIEGRLKHCDGDWRSDTVIGVSGLCSSESGAWIQLIVPIGSSIQLSLCEEHAAQRCFLVVGKEQGVRIVNGLRKGMEAG